MGAKSKQILVKSLLERFIDQEELEKQNKIVESVDDVLNLRVYYLKIVEYGTAIAIEDIFKIYSIRSLSKILYENPFLRLYPSEDVSDYGKTIKDIKNKAMMRIKDIESFLGAILISQMIVKAEEQEKEYVHPTETKICVVGLENAGKTAILNLLGRKMGLEQLSKLKPTKNIARQNITLKDGMDLVIWDFGGQKDYRNLYIEEPEKYFLSTNLVLYVLDIQNFKKIPQSLKYFKQILTILEGVGEDPHIIVFLHKADPDIISNPSISIEIGHITTLCENLLVKFKFTSDIFPSSIYNFFTNEPNFSRDLKTILREQDHLNDPALDQIHQLKKSVKSANQSIFDLTRTIKEQIEDLILRVNLLEENVVGKILEESEYRPKVPSIAKSLKVYPPIGDLSGKSKSGGENQDAGEINSIEKQVLDNIQFSEEGTLPIDSEFEDTRKEMLDFLKGIISKKRL